MPLEMKIIADPKFKEYARRYNFEAPIIMGATLGALILGLQKTAMKAAQGRLMSEVYTAALPASAQGDAAYYLEVKKRRSGAAFKSVKKSEIIKLDAHTYTGSVYVDKADGSSYYYARILEFGGRTINYAARPFWRVTKAEMVVLTHTMGPKALSYIKGKLKGGAAGGSGILEVV